MAKDTKINIHLAGAVGALVLTVLIIYWQHPKDHKACYAYKDAIIQRRIKSCNTYQCVTRVMDAECPRVEKVSKSMTIKTDKRDN